MKLDFDLGERDGHGVRRRPGRRNGQTFVAVPVDADVQAALREMVQATWDAMKRTRTGRRSTSRRRSTEQRSTSIFHSTTKWPRPFGAPQGGEPGHRAAALADPADVFCYFARLTDKKKRRLTALRRATQFKGVLKSKNRLVRMLDDTLKIIEDTVFKLDNDFDLLVDADNVHILRPSGFEFAGKLQQAILDAVPENIKAIGKDLAFVDVRRHRDLRRQASACCALSRVDSGAGGDQEHRQGAAEETLQADRRRGRRVEGQGRRCRVATRWVSSRCSTVDGTS